MHSLSGYDLRQELYRSTTSTVYRGTRQADGRPVVLKVLNQPDPSPDQMACFQHEYNIVRELRLPGVVTAYSLEYCAPHWYLVLEDFGGVALAQRRHHPGALPPIEALELARQVAVSLGQLHRRRIVHKDINPANIVVHPATGQIKLIDFGIAAALTGTNATYTPRVLEGTLAYIAPEQTARTSRPLDERADFYALGVTLYELLTGQVPFPKTDALDLVHSHLAKAAVPPHLIEPAIPAAVSALVLKLMAKDPEDRYQSAFGIASDLQLCLDQIRTSGWVAPFALGAQDVPDRFTVTRQMYGRERETATMRTAFERACRGAGALLLISGDAGIGKSALVETLVEPITERGGILLAGKFDQLQRNMPYAALIQIFRTLGRRLLAEGTAELEAWSARLHTACGPNLGLIADVVPEVALIVGPQADVPALGATEAQHRFALLVQQFITVFTRPEHPLALVLDDLQWADVASLQLLEHLVNIAADHHLLVIGVYRDSEVDAAHPLRMLIEALGHGTTPLQSIRLAPLELLDVTQLLAATLHCPNERAGPLAELLVAQTGGNPFFGGEFLRSLHAEGLITFDYERGAWQWELDRIAAAHAGDVVELLAARVQRLGGQVGGLLPLAACLGNEFSITALATATDTPLELVASGLAAAAADGLIVPSSPERRAPTLDADAPADAPTTYRFVHDRVQQAAYELIPVAERPAVHWRIGERLWRAMTPQEQEDRLFMLVNQLGLGQSALPDRATGRAVAELHLLAGRKAWSAAAYEPAWRYFKAGVALLDPDAWTECYALARDLYGEATQAAYLAGDFTAMEQLASVALARAAQPLDMVDVYEARIQAYAVQNRMRDAVRTALGTLRELGVVLSERPRPAERRRAIAAIHTALGEQPIEALRTLPAMTDPTARAAMRILAGVASAAYNGMPDLFIVLVAQQVTLSMMHGNAPESAFAYATYGIILCNAGDIGLGAKFGRLAVDLARLPHARRQRGRTRHVVHTFITHWQDPLRSILPLCREDYNDLMEVGDVEFAAYALISQGYGGFVANVELERLDREMELAQAAISRISQTTALNYLAIFRQAVLNLRGVAATPWQLAGPVYHAEQMQPQHLAANDRPALFFAHTLTLMLSYLGHQYERAMAAAELVRTTLDGGSGSLTLPLFYLYDSLARLAWAEMQADVNDDARQRGAALRDQLHVVAANQRQFRRWAEHAPMNQQHRWHLVEAECARVRERRGEAREHYDQAITLARRHGYHADEALACELAGAYYVAVGLTRLARVYLGDARDAWTAWGAATKAQDLTRRYPELLTQGSGTGMHALDVTSVFRASHAIASELVFDRLLTTIMQIVIENAGARHGALLRGQPGQWLVEAEGRPETDITLGQGRAARADEFPLRVLNYVAHTHRPVVIEDLSHDEQFAGDAYVTAHRPRSALCAPLLRQGTFLGVLYLENDLAGGVFTPERVEIVSLLAGQVAISIENASLYSHLEELVAARTVELTAANERLKTLNDRLQTELQLARHIQEHLLLPARPAWSELDVCCASKPAREVGGDFYLYHAFPGPGATSEAGAYALMVGDISGKGMPAALMMAISLGLFQTMVVQRLPPAALLAQFDQALALYTHTTRQNCALVYVEVGRQGTDAAAHRPTVDDTLVLRAASAGGVTPLIKRSDGEVEWVEVGGLPLGVTLASKLGYREESIRLTPGDLLILISDGVIEAGNERGELFGFERFEETVRSGPQHSAEAMLHHLQTAITEFGGAAEPHDDMTLVVVRP